MQYSKVDIGELIKNVVLDSGMTKMEFAKQIGLQRQNVEKTIFSKHGIDTDMLIKISEVLNFDFFQYYKPDTKSNKKDYIKPIRGKLTLEFGENKKEQVFKFEFGENNIEILNK